MAAALLVLGRSAVSAKAAEPRLWAKIGPAQQRLADQTVSPSDGGHHLLARAPGRGKAPGRITSVKTAQAGSADQPGSFGVLWRRLPRWRRATRG